jgi:hypothetical protein
MAQNYYWSEIYKDSEVGFLTAIIVYKKSNSDRKIELMKTNL